MKTIKLMLLDSAMASLLLLADSWASNPHFELFASASATGFQETPLAIHTSGRAKLQLMETGNGDIAYVLRYRDLEGQIEESVGAHIHFGKPGLNGGVLVFLCGTATVAGPPGTPLCASDGNGNGEVTGVITSNAILPITDQNFPASNMQAFRRAVQSGTTYLNLHTDRFASGEVRGRLSANGLR